MKLAATPSQTAGPFFSVGLCAEPANELVSPGAPGAIRIEGRVADGAGDGVPDALVEIWQANPAGRYEGSFGFGRCATDGEGRYGFVTVKPGSVAADDGTAQAPHLLVLVFARGLQKPVLTRMYFPDEEAANATDPVLAAVPVAGRATLVAGREDAGLRFDIRLRGEHQTVFFVVADESGRASA